MVFQPNVHRNFMILEVRYLTPCESVLARSCFERRFAKSMIRRFWLGMFGSVVKYQVVWYFNVSRFHLVVGSGSSDSSLPLLISTLAADNVLSKDETKYLLPVWDSWIGSVFLSSVDSFVRMVGYRSSLTT